MAGVFGKMPAAGDFVARGLPSGAAQPLDRWLTRHLAAAAADPGRWPDGGVRALIEARPQPLLIVAVASADRAGRSFPLVAVDAANGAGRAEADAWADRALGPLAAAAEGGMLPDDVTARLAAVPGPAAGAASLTPTLAWTVGTDAGDPASTLRAILAARCTD